MGKRKCTVPQRLSCTEPTTNLLQSLSFSFNEEEVLSYTPKKIKKSSTPSYLFSNQQVKSYFDTCLNTCYVSLKLYIFSELQTNFKGTSLIPISQLKVQILITEPNALAQELGLPTTEICHWYVSTCYGCSMFFFEEAVDKKEKKKVQPIKATFIQVNSDLPKSIINAMKCNLVLLQCTNIDFDAGFADLHVLIKETALFKLNYPSENSQIKRTAVSIQTLMDFFYNIKEPSYHSLTTTTKPDINKLFAEVRKIHKAKLLVISDDLQHSALKPQLRDYQKKSVAWMLRQEDKEIGTKVDQLHPLFTEFQTLDGKVLYYNKYGGIIVEKKPILSAMPSGGILADEMGLGKTVEVLSCLLLHPRTDVPDWIPTNLPQVASHEEESNNDEDTSKDEAYSTQIFQCICGSICPSEFEADIQCFLCKIWLHTDCIEYNDYPDHQPFLCPHCQVASDPIPSGATLIVAPMSIRYQWLEEINKHLEKNTFKVFVYEGVGKQRYVQPNRLASYDIVVTTYETLCKELNYVDLPHSSASTQLKFRRPKRFMAIPSPMVAVQWWRICLDEAQMVECTTTKTAEMASRLTALNRWCVTGTPIQKNIDDLHGLFLFLGVDPYWVQQWWYKLLYNPFLHGIKDPLYQAVATVLWRTAKKHVINEINIPCQTETVHWLSFSPVEEHFYRRQYGECVRDVMKQLSKWENNSIKLSSIDRKILSQLLQPLIRLRQACCHPQAVRGEFHNINKITMTMEELLQFLIKKGVNECEELHRQAIFARHGMAGINIIKGQVCDAINNYREVLWSVREHRNYFRTDDLQLLHCYHNLNELLATQPEGIGGAAVEDEKLQEKADEIRKQHVKQNQHLVKDARDNWHSVKQKADDLRKQLTDEEWWIGVLDLVVKQDKTTALLNKINEELISMDHKGTSLTERIHSINVLKFIVYRKQTALTSDRTKILRNLKKFNGKEPSQKEIDETVSCCIRAEKRYQQFKCQMCLLRKDLDEYETCLFRINKSDVLTFSVEDNDEDDTSVLRRRAGNWREGELETMLKCIASYLPFLYHTDPSLDQQAAIHLKHFKIYRKEYPLMSKLVLTLRDQVRVYDELSMCVSRMRLPYPGEETTKASINVVPEKEIKRQENKLRYEKIAADSDLKKKLGQLFYLQNLAKDTDSAEGSNPTQCSICLEVLKNKWAVLVCGHFYCISCICIIIRRCHGSLKCPTCRRSTQLNDINYVSTEKSSDSDSGVTLKGSYSTKVTAIIHCLLKIRQKDPLAKALVFSTWQSVLAIIGQALTDNAIQFTSLSVGKQSQNNLASFKGNPNIAALLLPVRSGCNGLNLVEATHVILTEPILNPAQELQAIGRVHRIGQTKSTEVHRFLIKATIEERMSTMLSSAMSTPDRNDTTLTIGDLYSLFRDVSDDSASVNSMLTSEESQTTSEESQTTPEESQTTPEESQATPEESQTATDDADSQSVIIERVQTHSDMRHRCAEAALQRISA